MKKLLAILLSLAMVLSLGVCAFAADEAANEAAEEEEAAEPVFAEFAPNADYDVWTLVEYEIEDIGAEFVCTVSAKEDFSEFYLECNFYGDDQMTKTTYDNKEFTVVEDLTGFMGGDTPKVLQMALDADNWLPMPEFDPNGDYEYFTTVDYEIEDIGAEFVCTISTKEDFSEFYLECNFYGDDQMTKTTYDGKEFTVVEDLTGFMGGDTPKVLQMALDANLWAPIGE